MIGDDVLKHVATRVTIDGTAPEGSPVEASLTSINIDRHDQVSTTRKRANWKLGLMDRTPIREYEAFIEKLKGTASLHFQ